MRFGVIAEDMTDCDAIAELIRRIAAQRRASLRIGVSKKGEAGCARIARKAGPHLKLLASQGCTAAIVVRDLDRNSATNALNDIAELRQELSKIPIPPSLKSLFCIPVEELEAWFWSDQAVLDRVAGQPGRARAVYQPHDVQRPKEALLRLSRGENRKPRYSTNDNVELAKHLDIAVCSARCDSFRELLAFVEAAIAPLL